MFELDERSAANAALGNDGVRGHPEIPRDVRDEHRLIFEAALARDIPNVAQLSAVHIRRTSDLVREVLGLLTRSRVSRGRL